MTGTEDLMQQYEQMIDALQKENETLKTKLEWYDMFVDYVQYYDNNIYDSACEHADRNDEEQYFETANGLSVSEVKEYYLNTGNPDYEEEPYISYTDLDWIDYADSNDLER